MTQTADLDDDARYAAIAARDRRFDGLFFTAVLSTGIYCRPSCPARTPARERVRFHPSAASAQEAGFRACKRCLPDATPGSPEWDVRAGTADRAVRLIADGVVDRDGVQGLADRLGYTPRHLGRLLVEQHGAGPLALARARRAQNARVLLETTDLGLADVAFAAGFSSVRQFNETVRAVYDATPSHLRARGVHPRAGWRGGARGPGDEASHGDDGVLRLRLAVRTPFDAPALLDFLAYHLVPGVETAEDGWYARTLDLPHGAGTLRLDLADTTLASAAPGTAQLHLELRLADLRDTGAALERARRLVDADADPGAVAAHLAADPVLAPLVGEHPGLRVPGQVDGAETALRTVVGQQISVSGARTVLGRVVAEHGARVETGLPGLTRLFPGADVLAAVDPETLPMPRARGRALVGLAAALAAGEVDLERGAGRADVRERLLALTGIGPWTADYVAMRALADPDVFLPTDVGVRTAATRLGHDPAEVVARSAGWSPWRSYALMHLWQTLMPPTPTSQEAAR
ncbi:AlkA N-terminal domain-containing protein [Nocardioides bruguierae]|uniref:DNA-3-methyladenine glycosylase II n=1 Tax=Nocardioides bruguierae TaxID=2945102 RepID=A0A9X2IFG2_9ACTN|nr:AlkA N-terminal domain-containing protein [Nocardioides bruguierae]MCM0619690.1 helix-turn-helix domain-containing protein [Nocardioides bruguierae]